MKMWSGPACRASSRSGPHSDLAKTRQPSVDVVSPGLPALASAFALMVFSTKDRNVWHD